MIYMGLFKLSVLVGSLLIRCIAVIKTNPHRFFGIHASSMMSPIFFQQVHFSRGYMDRMSHFECLPFKKTASDDCYKNLWHYLS